MLTNINFSSSINYFFDLEYSCEDSGCYDERICRCSKIINFQIDSVDLSSLTDTIYDIYFDNLKSNQRNNKINSILFGLGNEIDKYTINRLLKVSKIWESFNWEEKIINGYYGQELSTIYLIPEIALKLESELKRLFSTIDLNQRILELLKLEYGFVLPELIGKSFEIIEVQRDKIQFSSKSQLQKVEEDINSRDGRIFDFYNDKNYNLPRGIVIQHGDGFRLIDGYHRCFVSENELIKVIKVVS